MISWKGSQNGGFEGNCLSEDVLNLPTTGQYATNGTSVFIDMLG